MIVGEETPDSGSLTVGETVDFMYASQSRDTVDQGKTVFDSIADGNEEMDLGGRTVKTRAYLSWFNFRGASHSKMVGDLSGGERARLDLARVTCKGGNLLVLDEPSNDADAGYLRSLETAILNFAGSVIIVSHDRALLDRTCSHILAIDDDGSSSFFYGNFASYEEDRRKKFGEVLPSRRKFVGIPSL